MDFRVFSWKIAVEIGEGSVSGRDIDRKLRLTAAVLGAVTRKDLAAAFRRANPATTFDVDRANKWLQGRARPRELSIYEDWAKLLDLGRPGQWIAECDVDAFIDAICARHDCQRETLERHGRETARRPAASNGAGYQPAATLAGTFVSYSYASSPYFRGRTIGGELSIRFEPAQKRLTATFAQNLPTGIARVHGPLAATQRTLNIELRLIEANLLWTMCLFRPATLPASVLAGYLTGVALLSSETEITTTRMVLVRVPETCTRLSTGAYLPADRSPAADLAALGMPLADPAEADRRIAAFLMAGHDRGMDRITSDEYTALTEFFDHNWLTQVAPSSPSALAAVARVAG